MPENLTPWTDPELEARVVALVLGEASDFERDQLHEIIAGNAELAAFQKRMEAIHGLLHEACGSQEAAATPNSGPWQLPGEQRQPLLDVLSAASAAQPAPRKRTSFLFRPAFWWSAAACLVLGIFASLLMPAGFQTAKSPPRLAAISQDEREDETVRSSQLGLELDKSAPALASTPAAPPPPPALAPTPLPARAGTAESSGVKLDQLAALRDGFAPGAAGAAGDGMAAFGGGAFAGKPASEERGNLKISSERLADGEEAEEHFGRILTRSAGKAIAQKGDSYSGGTTLNAGEPVQLEDPVQLNADSSSSTLAKSGAGTLTISGGTIIVPAAPSSGAVSGAVAKNEATALGFAYTTESAKPASPAKDLPAPAAAAAPEMPAIIAGQRSANEPVSAVTLDELTAGDRFGVIRDKKSQRLESLAQSPEDQESEAFAGNKISQVQTQLRAATEVRTFGEQQASVPTSRLAGIENSPAQQKAEAPKESKDLSALVPDDARKGVASALSELKASSNLLAHAAQNSGSIRGTGVDAAGGRVVLTEQPEGTLHFGAGISTAAAEDDINASPARRGSEDVERQRPDHRVASNDQTRSKFLGEIRKEWEKPTPEIATAKEPFSTFSLHVSDVSFKLAQASLGEGKWPDPSRIRIEEFVNAFDYGDPSPATSEPVACTLEQAIHPFQQARNLLRISLRTASAGRGASTPLRLTLLLDSSGSMERSDRRQALQAAVAQLAGLLQPNDRVTLISFARQPKLITDQLPGDQSKTLLEMVAKSPSEGGTNLEAALQLATEKAREHFLAAAQNRIVLLTDGAANLGDANPARLSQYVEAMRRDGIAFDTAGIGADGLNDAILEALTRKGDGRYYLLNRPEDADSNFATQLAGAFRPAARNVKVQVWFNPERVRRYRLLGFEEHRLKKEDFKDDRVDAAELAAAEAGVALYQFESLPEGSGDNGYVSVRFQDAASGQMIERRWPIPYVTSPPPFEKAPAGLRLAASAAFLAAKLGEDWLAPRVDFSVLDRAAGNEDLRTMIQQTRNLSTTR